MTFAIKLVVKHFDSMENIISSAEYTEIEQLFLDEPEKTAHQKCSEYVKTLSCKPYLAWNCEVYPQFIVSRIFVR